VAGLAEGLIDELLHWRVFLQHEYGRRGPAHSGTLTALNRRR
jgi:hypothetical protein